LARCIAELKGNRSGNDDEAAEVAQALKEQYRPRFAGGELPVTATGRAVAVTDRLDTLVGIFAIGQMPTGASDPFAAAGGAGSTADSDRRQAGSGSGRTAAPGRSPLAAAAAGRDRDRHRV
jgi:hypothetical protein